MIHIMRHSISALESEANDTGDNRFLITSIMLTKADDWLEDQYCVN